MAPSRRINQQVFNSGRELESNEVGALIMYARVGESLRHGLSVSAFRIWMAYVPALDSMTDKASCLCFDDMAAFGTLASIFCWRGASRCGDLHLGAFMESGLHSSCETLVGKGFSHHRGDKCPNCTILELVVECKDHATSTNNRFSLYDAVMLRSDNLRCAL